MIHRALPEPNATLVGYAALIDRYGLAVPLPFTLSAISIKHKKYQQKHWNVFTPRYMPEDTLYGHLVFALRYEALDLAVLRRLFHAITASEIQHAITQEPNGAYARRMWFLYEYLLDTTLDIPDLTQGNFVDLMNSTLQYAGPSRNSKRHRVRNNLPGTKHFCPLIRRTETLDRWIAQDLSHTICLHLDSIPPDIIMRATHFLLLADSKASYRIEGETPPHHRAEQWARAIGQAGKTPLSKSEFERLQHEIIVNQRFVRMGYRTDGGFIGRHDHTTNMPIPSHISARPSDLDRLMEGLIDTATLLKNSDFPPVLAAAMIAFGFVFIHPFEDGNGRLHRYLLHHILTDMDFVPEGMIFPISAVILKHLPAYVTALEAYSTPRLSLIKWRATEKGNIEVLNDTHDLYCFFDATIQAEFLYHCVYETITHVVPEEITYLQRYDKMKHIISQHIDMPSHRIDLLIRFLQQNGGTLSKRARTKEFAALRDDEIGIFEQQFTHIFEI